MVLNAIYEGDFVGFSYGFRPGRGPHDGLDALTVAITTRKVNWILDADVQNFFGSVNQDWLVQFLEHRIGDKRMLPPSRASPWPGIAAPSMLPPIRLSTLSIRPGPLPDPSACA